MDPAAITQSSRTEVEAVVDRLTADLADAIERQTVTSEVLQAIGGSASEVQPVFETVIRHAVRLCGADAGTIYQLDGDVYEVAVALGGPPEGVARGLAVVMAVGFPVVEVYERLRHHGYSSARQRGTGDCGERAGDASGDERAHDAATEAEQHDRRCGEDRELPSLGEGKREWDRGADDRADRRWAGAVEKAPDPRVGTQLVEALGADENEREGGRERDGCREQPATEPGRGVADDSDCVDDRPGVI